MKYLSAHEILNHGPEGEQYFQGCGVSGTEFAYVVTGVGDTLRQALEDALEQAAGDTGGAPFASLERVVKEYAAGCQKSALDRSVHADHDKVCAECDAPVRLLPLSQEWVHASPEDDTHEDVETTPEDDCEDCEVHHYVSIRWSTADVVLRLDNMDRDDGMVLVLTETGQEIAEAVEDDRYLEGDAWEDSGDFSPYNIIMDRVGLVESLCKEGYVLDLSEYVAPEDHDFAATLTDLHGNEHTLQATTLAVLADLVNDVDPAARVQVFDVAGSTRGWVGPRGDWRAT